jgi:hypothetical protein
MPRHLSYPDAAKLVHSRADLTSAGWRSRDITVAVASGRITRLQRNRYAEADAIAELWPESRRRVDVAAAASELRDGNGVFAYESAASLWELPLYRQPAGPVHVSLPEGERMSSRHRLRRHSDQLPADDLAEVDGVPCTSLERTVWDLIRTLPYAAAVAVADAGLRRSALRDRRYDAARADAWRTRMFERVAGAPGARGIRQAIRVIEFADGRAELPGESVTRVHLERLGFARVGLQVPVLKSDGGAYRVDLEIEDLGVFVEFDGLDKYGADLRGGARLDDVLLAEKRREDWIRGVTNKRLIRLESKHIVTADALRERLAAFGITTPR